MKIGIYTYGRLGRGLELAVRASGDAELVGIFSRRGADSISTEYPETRVFHVSELQRFTDEIDVLLVAGGSAADLPEMSPRLAKDFNIVDSFDTHSKINGHFSACDKAALSGSHTAIVACGWDPGIFSLVRLMSSVLGAESYSFWGEGVSQGHSEAIRRIKGVKDAIEYTVPREAALSAVRKGEGQGISRYDMHRRICYVVLEDFADKEHIRSKIINMPDYFFGYETEVNFVSAREMSEKHSKISHGGRVISLGNSGKYGENPFSSELSLSLSSNPEFTARVLLAYARAAYRMSLRRDWGAKSVFDIPPSYLSPLDPATARERFL